MVTSIGGARPPRLYIEEWMATVPGLDRKRLAERMGVSPGTISKKLKTPGHIDAEWMEKFRHALDLPSVVDLFRDPSAPTQADLLQGLTPEQKTKVEDYAAYIRQRPTG